MVARLVSNCPHRVPLIHLNDPSKLAGLFLLEWHPYWSHCGRRARPFGGRALREQGTSMGAIPVSFIVRVLRAKRAPGCSLLILRRPRVARAKETYGPPFPPTPGGVRGRLGWATTGPAYPN